jgi:hypothetical protein
LGLAGLALTLVPSLAWAQTFTYQMRVDTAPLQNPINASGAPYRLEFQFNDGAGSQLGNNTITITNVQFPSGGGPLNDPFTSGGASGSLTSGVTITDTSVLNFFDEGFTAGPEILFDVTFTSNANVPPPPDQFVISILDNTLSPIATTDPGGSLLTADLATQGGQPTLTFFAGTVDPQNQRDFTGVVITAQQLTPVAIPEPTSLALFAVGLGGVLVCTVRRRRASP